MVGPSGELEVSHLNVVLNGGVGFLFGGDDGFIDEHERPTEGALLDGLLGRHTHFLFRFHPTSLSNITIN